MAQDGPDGKPGRATSLDRRALAAIYDEFRQPIYGYIYRQIEEVETARDLTADVFRRLLQASVDGRGPDRNAKAWLFRTAHNVVVDYYRSQQVRRDAPRQLEHATLSEDPVELAERHLQAAEVLDAWHHLTPDQQQVIALKFMQELSNEEVAAIMDKPVTAVKSLQHRALAALRRQLEQREERATS